MSEKQDKKPKVEKEKQEINEGISENQQQEENKSTINEQDIIEAIRKKQAAKQQEAEKKEKEKKIDLKDLKDLNDLKDLGGIEGLDFNAIKDQAEAFYKEINAQVQKSEEQAAEYRITAQRVQAEFDNFRKRNAYAVSEAFEEGQLDIIKNLLPIIDNFERALETLKDGTDTKVYEGVELIYKQCLSILQANNVEEIDALGKQFDPNLHNAVMQAPVTDGQNEDQIVAVFQKGYKKGDKIIRHSMVNVAK